VEWFAEKGYGFIKPDEHGRDNIFLHISQVSQKMSIARGAAVSYRCKFDAVKKSDTASCVELEPAKDTTQHTRSHFGNNNKRVPYNEFEAANSYNNASKPAYATGAIAFWVLFLFSKVVFGQSQGEGCERGIRAVVGHKSGTPWTFPFAADISICCRHCNERGGMRQCICQCDPPNTEQHFPAHLFINTR
jgi:cold shock CspA family protein